MPMLASCASLDKQLAIGYGTNTMTRRIATDALNNKKITVVEAETVLKGTDKVREFLDLGYKFRNINKDSTKTYLHRAEDVLTSTDDLLIKKGLMEK